MRKVLAVAAVVAAAALLVGCFETKQDFTLNPDGSGKVLVEMVMPQMPFALGPTDGQGRPPDLAAKQSVKGILDGSKGVDVWSDVRHERTEDGRTKFIGTAYFKDLAQLKLQAGKMEGITFTKDDSGGMVLLLEEPESPAPPPEPPKEIPEEQLNQRIQAQQMQYQQMRPMMATMLGTMKMDISFRLPGALVEVSGFKKEPSGAVRLAFDGAQMLKAMDELMADDAYIRQNALAGKKGGGGPQMDEWTKEKLFGTKGPLRARVTGPFASLFPYESEVKAAKAAYPKMIERLGLDKLPPALPTPTLPPGFGLPEGRKGVGG